MSIGGIGFYQFTAHGYQIKVLAPESGFPANSSVTWCPHCGDAIHVELRGVWTKPWVIEERCEAHLSLYHPIRWWLWQRFGWKRAIRGAPNTGAKR